MTEIVALQLFLADVRSPVACGERMSAEQYQELMWNVKHQQAACRARSHCTVVAKNEEEHHA